MAQVILRKKQTQFIKQLRERNVYKKLCDFDIRIITPNRKYDIPLNLKQKLYWFSTYIQHKGNKIDLPYLPPEIWNNILNIC